MKFTVDWEKMKKEVSDDYYKCYHQVIGKITRFKFKLSELIKNKFEDVKEVDYNFSKNVMFKDLNKKLYSDFVSDVPNMQPVFSSLIYGKDRINF